MYRILIFFVFVLTLFGFKLSILGRTGDDSDNILSAIRIDDIVIMVFLISYTLKGGSWGYFFKQKPITIFILYVLFCLFSAIYNSIFGQVAIGSSLLFALRPLEYFLYIALGSELARLGYSLDRTFRVYIIYCLLLIAGQTSGIIGGISNFSFSRAIANTGGPWELAGVSAFFLCYFFQERVIIYTLLSAAILVLTQSRITLVGSVFVLSFANVQGMISLLKRKLTVLMSLVFIFSIILYALYSNINGTTKNNTNSIDVTARIEAFFSNETFLRLYDIYANTDAAVSRNDYFEKTYGGSITSIIGDVGEGDASAYIRFTRWIMLIKTTNSDLVSFLIGLGPSYAAKAVDGNYVRFFAETGIVGLILYLLFLINVLMFIKNRTIRNYILILSITAMFIDIFVTHKAMFLFWLLYGYHLQTEKSSVNNKVKTDENSLSHQS
ncbi:O-antigen ligase family protein [Edaphovirga cremea]|uniref:O-antigen ligase family protein n=1 Tax=Edaphovirga cremea TaxID=2267246 RepID=UPI000DEF098E|nr:O-antigen ligase family protein [Edaphovirga cremea]